MLESLKFVKGAIGKKNDSPIMRHFQIRNGNVTAHNGRLTISAPIALDIDCKPEADALCKAIDKCNDQASLTLLKNDRLVIKSKKLKVIVNCSDFEFPPLMPEGDIFDIDGDLFIKALSILNRFISDKVINEWAKGVLFKGQSAFATDNTILVEHWLKAELPRTVNIPKSLITEILRIKESPERLQISDSSITIHYPGNRWVRSQLLTSEWPNVNKVLDCPSDQITINPDFFDALESISPFVDDLKRVYFLDNLISTSPNKDHGTTYHLDNFLQHGVYNLTQLMLLKDVINTADFSKHPKPCHFQGDNLRGVLMGMRD